MFCKLEAFIVDYGSTSSFSVARDIINGVRVRLKIDGQVHRSITYYTGFAASLKLSVPDKALLDPGHLHDT